MISIGIIGKGFVGTAVAAGFSSSTGYEATIRIYDKVADKSTHTLDETVNKSDIVFISVPTPASKNGEIDLSIVENLLNNISDISNRDDNIILLRSTMVPGTCNYLQKKYSKLNIVFNPEFLTERSAHFDFINQNRVILGGDSLYTEKVADLYRDRFGSHLPIIRTSYETAELIKYMNNLFFATKVSFMNEMRLVCDEVGANWEEAVNGFILDGRIGHSHINVPGHDGKLGFGGSCFPKDIQAMIHFCEDLGISPNVLKGAWETNLHVRPEKDWEKLKGRAVSEDD